MLKEYWNGRLLGLAGALLNVCLSAYETLLDKIFSFCAPKNLGGAKSGVEIHHGVKIKYPNNVVLGGKVKIGRNTLVYSEFPTGKLVVGDLTWINRDCFLDMSGGIYIGEQSTISEGVKIYTHDHGKHPRSVANTKEITISKNVWIGTESIILHNVESIGEGAIVAARSVVTKNVLPYTIVAGNPAKVIGKINEKQAGSDSDKKN